MTYVAVVVVVAAVVSEAFVLLQLVASTWLFLFLTCLSVLLWLPSPAS